MREAQLFDQLSALLEEGNSASRQMACHAHTSASTKDSHYALQRVVDLLLDETRSNAEG
ncbi:hypothetical protein D3C78_1882910 [compost metagenome]